MRVCVHALCIAYKTFVVIYIKIRIFKRLRRGNLNHY